MASWEGQLVVCAGAGLSMPYPTMLPSGEQVARLLARRLRGLNYGGLIEDCDETDLLCIADALDGLVGGADLLQRLLPEMAGFTDAEPNFAHEALATLILAGLATVTETNWDDCIERADQAGKRIQSIVSNEDRAQVRGPSVLKLHGCATRQGTLLASSAQLENPPEWAFFELGGRLGDSTVVFLGLGRVPPYARLRVRQILAEAALARVIVVAPNISAEWDELARDLPPENRLPLDGREFLDDLLRGLVGILFMLMNERAAMHKGAGHLATLGVDPELAVSRLQNSMNALSGLGVINWLVHAAVRWPDQDSPVRSEEAMKGLVAISILLFRSLDAVVEGPGSIRADGRLIQFFLTRGVVSADVSLDMLRRLEDRRSRGETPSGSEVLVLVSGEAGPLPKDFGPDDVVDEPIKGDVIDGPRVGQITFWSTDEILRGRLPEGWEA